MVDPQVVNGFLMNCVEEAMLVEAFVVGCVDETDVSLISCNFGQNNVLVRRTERFVACGGVWGPVAV
jgi:hypothetical protein